MFIDRLIGKIKEKNNPSVVGLDPLLEYVPAHIRDKHLQRWGRNFQGAASAILEFNQQLIDSLYDIVPAVKLQLACYEMLGVEGLMAYQQTVRYAKEKGLLIIADGKRNDIGSTAQCYSRAFLGRTALEGLEDSAFDADALTVNPYLGADGIRPFVEDCERYGKGIFALVKTSNDSSGQLQDLELQGGRRIFEAVADLVLEWGRPLMGEYGYSSVGAVVGATYPEQAAELRARMKGVFFLIPGFGAQGGTAADVAHGFDAQGIGGIVNASRSILCAYRSEAWKGQFGDEAFARAARAEALKMRDELNEVLTKR